VREFHPPPKVSRPKLPHSHCANKERHYRHQALAIRLAFQQRIPSKICDSISGPAIAALFTEPFSTVNVYEMCNLMPIARSDRHR
jgi:hypothetical protein